MVFDPYTEAKFVGGDETNSNTQGVVEILDGIVCTTKNADEHGIGDVLYVICVRLSTCVVKRSFSS